MRTLRALYARATCEENLIGGCWAGVGSGALGGGSCRGGVRFGGSPGSGSFGSGCLGPGISGSILEGSYSGLSSGIEKHIVTHCNTLLIDIGLPLIVSNHHSFK